MTTLAERSRSFNSRSRWRHRPGLILLTDSRRLADPLPLLPLLPAGSLVILRHYDAPGRAALGQALARACRVRRLRLLVAADFALARQLGAGLHLPEGLARQTPPRLRLWRRQGHGPLTVAAHGRAALVQARRLGADAALLSPVFPTASHPGAPVLGALMFRRLSARAGLAVYALGGITAATIGRLRGAAAGVATVGGLKQGSAPHPARSRGAPGPP